MAATPRNSRRASTSNLDANSSTVNLSPLGVARLRRTPASRQVSGTRTALPRQVEQEADEDDDSILPADEAEDRLDRLRTLRQDAMQQHLYSTAAFWGSKAYEMNGDPNDAFWLAQIHFLTHQHARAERILTAPTPDPSSVRKGKGPAMNGDAEILNDLNGINGRRRPQPTYPDNVKLVRLTDISLACKYLAAQCMIRQNKWSEALDLLGEVNPFAESSSKKLLNGLPANTANGTTHHTHTPSDGGIKFEASLCHLRGLIHLHLNSGGIRAKECFLEALSLDVRCFEAFEALVDGNMLTVDEEWSFIQGLAYKEQTPEDAEFIRMAYSVRLKKYKHHAETALCRTRLATEYNLSKDPDVLFGLADSLFAALRWSDCYKVTSSILATHEGHGPTLPLHLACMYHLPALHSVLFLMAHELVDRGADAAVSWYAVGLWYFASKRWDEARRFFGKAVLLDSRFGPAWIAFAHAYALEGEHDQAITAYSTAQRHFRGTHLPLLFIGMQHLQLANVNLGREYLDTAWGMCQDDPLLANEMGVAAYWRGDLNAALEFFSTGMKLVESAQGEESAWVHMVINLAHTYRQLRRYDDAISAFSRAIDMDPSLAAGHLGLGYVLAVTGKQDDAIERLHEALSRAPADPLAVELLKCTLESAVDSQTNTSSSKVAFPGLAGHIAAALDAEVIETDREVAAEFDDSMSMALDETNG